MAKKRKVTSDLKDIEKSDIIRSKEVAKKMKARTVSKWVALVLVIALLITGSAWGILTLVDYNSMKITINKDSMGSIALSPDDSFDYPTSNITVKGPESMDATTFTQLGLKENVLSVVGTESSPATFMAYSVYLKNFSSTRDIEYATMMTIPNTHKDFEKAIRIMVIKENQDGVINSIKVYAHAKEDGTPEYISYDTDDLEKQKPIPLNELNQEIPDFLETNETVPFKGYLEENPNDKNFYIDFVSDQPLKVGESVKYIVALWVEGTDADCKDNILGGFSTVRLEFAISSSDIDEDQILPNAK